MTEATDGSLSAQPDHLAALTHFREWLADVRNRTKCSELREGAKVETHEIVPKSHITTYFTPNRIRLILNELFPREVPVRQDLVQERCVIGFCILLSIGHGRYVGELSKHQALCDWNLPFQGQPMHLPQNVWKDFTEAQWPFTPANLRRGVNKLPKEMPLPYLEKELIGEGMTACLYKVTVHTDYDLEFRGAPSNESPTVENRVYALKMYKGQHAYKNYLTETGNFERICSYEAGHKSPPGLIAYFGGYEHGDTFNMLLEYGEGGSLHDYLIQTGPPTTGKPIYEFWSRLLVVLKGLSRIHGLEGIDDDPESSQRYQGTHHDIRPENIILVRDQRSPDTGSENGFGYHFKLADLGNGQFVKRGHGHELHDLKVMDGRGGRNYGSPESCRASEFTNRSMIRVTPRTDIFSLGCVLLTVAVWLVHGRSGVDEFNKERFEENRQSHLEADYRFHNGNPGEPKLLAAVTSRLEGLPPELRIGDCTTGKVLKRLIKSMLIPEVEARHSARQLCYEMGEVLQKAKENLDAATNRHFSMISQERLDKAPLDRNTSISRTTLHESGHILNEGHAQGSVSPTYSRGGFVNSPRNTLNLSTTSPPQSPGAFTSSPESSRFPVLQSGSRNLGQLTQNGHHESNDQSRLTPRALSIRSRGGNEGSAATSHNHDHRASYGSQQAADTTTPSSTDLEARSASPIAEEPDMPTTPTRTGVQHSISVPGSPTPNTSHNQQSPPIPSAFVLDALEWKRKRKRMSGMGKLFTRDGLLGNEHCKRWLKERDHFFLIDDSHSMVGYWRHVADTFEALSYIVKECDPDGLDVQFVCSRLHYHGKTTRGIVEKVANHHKAGNADIKRRLTEILRPKLSALENVNSRRIFRPISIYVLTDGVWAGNNDAKSPILEAIEVLRANGLPRSTIGISFISFGDGADVPENLSELDELGNSDGRDIDIVDTTRFDGNVWKMLVGAIDDYYDRS